MNYLARGHVSTYFRLYNCSISRSKTELGNYSKSLLLLSFRDFHRFLILKNDFWNELSDSFENTKPTEKSIRVMWFYFFSLH